MSQMTHGTHTMVEIVIIWLELKFGRRRFHALPATLTNGRTCFNFFFLSGSRVYSLAWWTFITIRWIPKTAPLRSKVVSDLQICWYSPIKSKFLVLEMFILTCQANHSEPLFHPRRLHRVRSGHALASIDAGRRHTGSETFAIQNHQPLSAIVQRRTGHRCLSATTINDDLSAADFLLHLSDLFAVYPDRAHLHARLLDQQRRWV